MSKMAAIIIFLFVWLAAPMAYAMPPAGSGLDPYCAPMDGLVQRMVSCIQFHIISTAYDFIYAIYPFFVNTIDAFLILSVVFFGVRMVLPMMEKPGRDAMIFLLKLGGIVFFTSNMDMILYWFVGVPNELNPLYQGGALGELINIVTAFTIFDFGAPLKCQYGVNIWGRVDCILDMIIGVNSDASLSNGMIGFFFHNFFVGSVGVLIFLLGVWMLFSFMLMLLGAIHTYLMAVIMICLLVIVGILFAPLVMFKNTFDIFQKWVRMLVANLIIPVILFAYANVMLTAFDIVLYSGEHSVFRTFAGGRVDAAGFNIHEYMYTSGLILEVEDKGLIHDERAVDRFDTADSAVIGGEVDAFGEYPGEAALLPNPGKISEIPIAIPMRKIDYDAAAGLRNLELAPEDAMTGPELLESVLASMIVTALVTYIMVALMKHVPGLAEELAGGVKESPRIAQVGMNEMPMVGSSGGATGITDGFRSRMSGMVGRR